MTKQFQTKCLVVLATSLCSLALQAQSLPAPPEAAPQAAVLVRTLGQISEYRLPNGLQVLLLPDASQPVATVNITYRVGSKHESAGETGSAHLLEHMLFKPSGKTIDAKADMAALGMRFNGTTNFDRTNYFASFLSSDAKAVERMDYMLGWLAGMMTQARFSRADLDTEMTVVRNEFERAENDPGRILVDRMRAAAFTSHGYRHSVLGAKSDIENIPLEALYAFYRKHYRPDNATLIVTGRFEMAAVLAKISAEFGPIAQPASPLPATYSVDPVQEGERSVILRRMGGLATAAVLYRAPAGGTAGGVAAQLLAETLRQRGGPLMRGLIAQQLAVTDWAYFQANREPGYLIAAVGLAEQALDSTDTQYAAKTAASAAALAAVVEDYQPTDAEVQSARVTLQAQWRALLRDAESTGQALSEMVALGDWRLIYSLPNALAAIRPGDVRRFAKIYLVASNRTAGTYLPVSVPVVLARARVPGIQDATQLVANYSIDTPANSPKDPKLSEALSTGPIQTPTQVQTPVQAESFEITPATLAQRTQRGRLLVGGAPGLQIAVLPRAAKDDRVVGTLRLRWGTAESLNGTAVMAALLAGMLSEGTDTMGALQIKARLQALDARINFFSSVGFLNASMEFPAANTAPVIELLNQLLTQSRFQSASFALLQAATLATLQNIKDNPANIAGNTLERSYRPAGLYPVGDPRQFRSFPESEALLRQTTADELRAHWQRFGSAQTGELTLVGPIELAPVQAQLQALWGEWASKAPYQPWVEAYGTPTEGKLQTIAMPGKANANYAGRIAIALSEQDPDYPALFTAVQLLSRRGLYEQVREKEGLSYGIEAQLRTQSVGQTASIDIQASFAPANLARLRRAVAAVLQDKRDNGFNSIEVNFAKSAILARRAEARALPANAASDLASRLRYQRPLDYAAKFDAAYQALDAKAVNAALKKYLNIPSLWEVVAGSFE